MQNDLCHMQQKNYKLGISQLHVDRFKKKILIFGYDFPNITFDVVVHFTNNFYVYLLIVFPSRYSKHVIIQVIILPRKRDPIVTFRTCYVLR